MDEYFFCYRKAEQIKKHKRISRPFRPQHKDAIIAWFRDEEKERSAVLDPQTIEPAEWFHGTQNMFTLSI